MSVSVFGALNESRLTKPEAAPRPPRTSAPSLISGALAEGFFMVRSVARTTWPEYVTSPLVLGTAFTMAGALTEFLPIRLSAVSPASLAPIDLDLGEISSLELWTEIQVGRPMAPERRGVQDKIPYATFIRSLMEADRVFAARHLTEAALRESPRDASLAALSRALAPAEVRASETRDVDRTREYRWLKENAVAYRGKWVALDGDTLLAQGDSLAELLACLKERGTVKPPLVHRIT